MNLEAMLDSWKKYLKNDYIGLYSFGTEKTLYQAVEEFAYEAYNHVRPHSYNRYKTPYQARIAAKYTAI